MPDQVANQPLYGTTPEALRQRRLYAAALMKQGMETTPIHHWSQGLGRVLQAGMGGYEQGQVDKEDRQGKSLATQNLLKSLQEYDGKDPSSIISAASDPNMPAGMGELIAKVLPQIGNRTVSGGGGAVSTPEAVPVINKDPSAAPAAPPQSGGAAPTAVSQAPLPAPGAFNQAWNDSVTKPVQDGTFDPHGANNSGAYTNKPQHLADALQPKSVPTQSIRPPATPPGLRPQDVATMHYLQNEGLNYKSKENALAIDQQKATDRATLLAQHVKEGEVAGDHLTTINGLLKTNEAVKGGFKGLVNSWASEHGLGGSPEAEKAEAFRYMLNQELLSEASIVNPLSPASNEFRSLSKQINAITPATGQAAIADILHGVAGHFSAQDERRKIALDPSLSDEQKIAKMGSVKPQSPFGRLGYPEEEKPEAPHTHGQYKGVSRPAEAAPGEWTDLGGGIRMRKKQ